jgi:hypothetical protein
MVLMMTMAMVMVHILMLHDHLIYTVYAGDHAGKLAIYDLERPDAALYSQQAHSSIINAIDGCGGMDIGSGAPEIVTGE